MQPQAQPLHGGERGEPLQPLQLRSRHSSRRRSRGALLPQSIEEAIRDATTLGRLQQLVQQHGTRLDSVHVGALLSRFVAFSQTEPATWFRREERRQQPAAGSSRLSGPAASSDHDGTWELLADDGDSSSLAESDDEDWGGGQASRHLDERDRRRRGTSALASSSGAGGIVPLRGKDRAEAARQLGLLVERVVASAADRRLLVDLGDVAAALRALVQLGYHDSKRVRALLDATQPALHQAAMDHRPSPTNRGQVRDTVGEAVGEAGELHVGSGAACSLETRQQQEQQQPEMMDGERGEQRQRRQRQQQRQQQQQQPAESCARAIPDLLRACRAMQVQPSVEWLQAAESATGPDALHQLTATEISVLAATLGASGHAVSEGWLLGCYSASQPLLPACKPSELLGLLGGLAAMWPRVATAPPPSAWLAAFCEASRPALPYMGGAQLTASLAALAVLGHRPDERWMATLYAALEGLPQQPGGSVLGAPQLTELVSGLARLGCRPEGSWMDGCLMRSRRALPAASTADLARLIAGLAMLRFRPSASEAGWLRHFLSAAFARLPFASPQQVCCIVHALAQLGQRPGALWMEELAGRARGKLGLFSGEQLAELAAALAKLGFRPRSEWLLEFERCSGSKLEACGSGALADMVWAMSRIGHKPQVSWLYSFVFAMYGRLDSFDSSQLCVVFEALPRISPYPTWLDELVQICATESSPAMRSRTGSWDEDEEQESGHKQEQYVVITQPQEARQTREARQLCAAAVAGSSDWASTSDPTVNGSAAPTLNGSAPPVTQQVSGTSTQGVTQQLDEAAAAALCRSDGNGFRDELLLGPASLPQCGIWCVVGKANHNNLLTQPLPA